jgi:Doublecortin
MWVADYYRFAVVCYVCRLYTTYGQKITDPSQIVNGGMYVAVGSEAGGFQSLDYGCTCLPRDSPGYKRMPFTRRRLSQK